MDHVVPPASNGPRACSGCGTMASASQRFCGVCGSAIVAAAPAPIPSALSTPSSGGAGVPPAATRRAPAAAAFVLLLLGIAAAGYYFGMRGPAPLEEVSTAQDGVVDHQHDTPAVDSVAPSADSVGPHRSTPGGEAPSALAVVPGADSSVFATPTPDQQRESAPSSTPPRMESFAGRSDRLEPLPPPSVLLERLDTRPAGAPELPAVVGRPPSPAIPVEAINPPSQPDASGVPASAVYTGPPFGVINWTGRLDRNGTLTIDGDRASVGTVSGSLPGVPIDVEFQNPDISIVEPPSPSNGWKRLVLRSRSSRSELVVIWSVLQ